MKRRTNPAGPRRSNPRPVSLERLFPGIGRLPDVEAFRLLYQISMMCSEGPDAAILPDAMATFLEGRGLAFEVTGDVHQGCEVWALSRGGDVLATFSVERCLASML